MKLRYTLPAFTDLARLLTYLEVRSPSGARNVRVRVEEITQLLIKHPTSGRRTRRGYRISTWPYPYLIFYAIQKDEIIIHAIRHDARDPVSMPQA